MELEKARPSKSGHGTGPLDKLGKFSSLLIKDGLRIARLAFIDVSAAEIMTEDATNTEEWGPTTMTMAAISAASKNYDDYERIVLVLRGRLSLTGPKKWRQVFKALTVMEYLLTRGPEQFITDFREDQNRVEELTRVVFVDENLVDRGSALQSKAKQVNQLLVDEKFLKEERRRAPTVSKGILGFGSQSSKDTARSDLTSLERPHFQKPGAFASKVDEDGHGKNEAASEIEPPSPISQRSFNWGPSSKPSADESPQMSSASTEWTPFDESPTASSEMSFDTASSPIAGGWGAPLPPSRDTSRARKISVDLEFSSTASSKPRPSSFKLPPPPPTTTNCRVPPPPPGGSKVVPVIAHWSRSRPSPQDPVPDLILM